MATGWTQAELDQLLAMMDEVTPPIPTRVAKAAAGRVTALRIGITDKGAVMIVETKGSDVETYWLNCWVAKELASGISFPSEAHKWAQKGFKPEPSDHLKEPEPSDLNSAISVHSLSTYGEPSGIIVRFARGYPVKHRTLFFPRALALELMLCLADGATRAGWWGEDLELIPSRESQN